MLKNQKHKEASKVSVPNRVSTCLRGNPTVGAEVTYALLEEIQNQIIEKKRKEEEKKRKLDDQKKKKKIDSQNQDRKCTMKLVCICLPEYRSF